MAKILSEAIAAQFADRLVALGVIVGPLHDVQSLAIVLRAGQPVTVIVEHLADSGILDEALLGMLAGAVNRAEAPGVLADEV